MAVNKENSQPLKNQETKKKRPKEDILDVVKQFISYFEETDRSEKNGNRI